MCAKGNNAGRFGPLTYEWIVVLVAAAIYLVSITSPPSLMDDVDAVQAQIARNMVDSGDWVTAHLNGVRYLEKPPLKYWMIAASYLVFGVHDWVARLPLASLVVLLCWLSFRFGRWAFGELVGFYTGLVMATSVGLWLFTRVQISDAMLTVTITLAMWGVLRAFEDDEPYPKRWMLLFYASIGVGLLFKGLIGAVFPVASGGLYLLFTGRAFQWAAWCRLMPLRGIAVILLVAAPWHILAAVRNPPVFDFTMTSGPGQYRGFFWFYFFNEHIFRFLGTRWPKDYNRVPVAFFWLFHLIWLFPWTAFLASVAKLKFRPVDRAGRTRLFLLCWAGFLLLFFSLSTTQEYYSMPAYPALAMLLASGMARGGRAVRIGAKALGAVCLALGVALAGVFAAVWNVPTPKDISAALATNTELYTLSLGHMADLTLNSFAYLRLPVMMAAVAFLLGAASAWKLNQARRELAIALMMVLFFHAARVALIAFDPYLSSRPLAEALREAPPGELIVDNQYYAFSSVFFYADTDALLLNGRVNNIEYGSYAPGAPNVFISDKEFRTLWLEPERRYLCVEGPQLPRIETLVGRGHIKIVKDSGGKFLLTNQ
jgi:4-amino-4-deoxy-L-arabinose transferase-like glycosyltransferase